MWDWHLTAALLLIAGGALGGMASGRSFEQRLSNIRLLQTAVNRLENEMLYYGTLLDQALSRVGEETGGIVESLFLNLSRGVSMGEDMERLFTRQIPVLADAGLKRGDMLPILDMGRWLGRSGKENQRMSFGVLREKLAGLEKEAETETKRKASLARKIGLLAGLAAAVLAI